MADWKDCKNSGPWDFIEQPDKWGYLNNPRWPKQRDAIVFCQSHGLSLDQEDQHKPCGHWHKDYVAGPELYDECSLEPFFDWPEFVSSESFIGYNGEKVFILQRVYADGKVYVYDIDGNSITNFSTIGTSPSCMKCLAVDNNYCFVGATANVIGPVQYAHIARFSHGGTYQTHWKVGSGTYGSGVQGVCSDGNYVYVTSTYGLHKYTRSGVLVWEFPYRDTGIGKFWTAYGLWSDKTHIFVVDYSSWKILKYLCSDGSFILEAVNMIPASPSNITVDDKYAYVSTAVFFKDTLEWICSPLFEGNAYDLGFVLGSVTYDGEYWWGLSKNTTVVKFDIHVIGELVEGSGGMISGLSDEPQVWIMPGDEAPMPADPSLPISPGPGGTPCVSQTSKLSQSLISVSVMEGSDPANRNVRVTDNCGSSLAFEIEEVNNNNWITWILSPSAGDTGNGSLNISFNAASLSAGNYNGNIVISTNLGNLMFTINLVVTSSPGYGEATGIVLVKGDQYRTFDFNAGEIKLFKFIANSGSSSPILTITTKQQQHGSLDSLVKYSGQNWELGPPTESDHDNVVRAIEIDPYAYPPHMGVCEGIYYYRSRYHYLDGHAPYELGGHCGTTWKPDDPNY